MIIIEIALGIVLAVIILVFWRQIIGIGIGVLALGALLVVVLAGLLVFFWVFHQTDEVLIVVLLVYALAVWGFVAFTSKKTGLTFDATTRSTGLALDPIVCFDVVAGGIGVVGIMCIISDQISRVIPIDFMYLFLFLAVLVSAGVLVALRIRKRKRLAAEKPRIIGPNP